MITSVKDFLKKGLYLVLESTEEKTEILIPYGKYTVRDYGSDDMKITITDENTWYIWVMRDGTIASIDDCEDWDDLRGDGKLIFDEILTPTTVTARLEIL